MEAKQIIMIIDLKAFYASVECADRQLDPFLTPLIVADRERGPGTIVLSVSPYLKSQGLPSRLRVYDLPKNIDYIFARPRMSRYLAMSAEVVGVMLDYFGEDDIHIYSIDELFVDMTPYLSLYNYEVIALAQEIKQRIQNELHLPSCIGLGPNMFLAKCALDLEAKKAPSGIAQWSKEEVETKLHPLTPLRKMWGISYHLEARLNNLGLFKVGDIARCPKEILISKFGLIGEELWNHAWGEDAALIREKYRPLNHHLSVGQVLQRDYERDEIALIIREMCDEVTMRLRLEKKFARSAHLYLAYSKSVPLKPITMQVTFNQATDNADEIFATFMALLEKKIQDYPIRKLSLTLGQVFRPHYEQLDLFHHYAQTAEERHLQQVIDEIKQRFGKDAVLRGTAALDNSMIIKRHKLIGGHHQ